MRYAVGRWANDRWNRSTADRSFHVAGLSAATTAASNECVFNVWNPSGTRSFWVEELFWAGSGGNAAPSLVRTSTQGVGGSTVTPDADNDIERELVPVTGMLLRLADFSTEPTLASPALYRANFPTSGAPHAMTWVFPGRGIQILPGTGLALASTAGTAIGASEVAVRFTE